LRRPNVGLYTGQQQMNSIEGFILIGGQSRRMGSDKAQLSINGKSFVEQIAEKLAPVTQSITLVGSAHETSVPFRTVPDVYPGWGALGGVHSALANCGSEWALIVACDFPGVQEDLFTTMAELRTGFDAVAPIQSDLVPQPLCTFYRKDPCLKQAEELIKLGQRKPIALLQSVRTRWVSFNEIEDLTGSAHFFDNINTPEDYARITGKRIGSAEAGTN
jgi:molybdopterin-guanine dinucleotide biosynthesis protein A